MVGSSTTIFIPIYLFIRSSVNPISIFGKGGSHRRGPIGHAQVLEC